MTTVVDELQKLLAGPANLTTGEASAVALAIELLKTQAAQPSQAGELSDAEIYKGWKQTFSTENPFCPCNLKSFTKSVNWAIAAINAKRPTP